MRRDVVKPLGLIGVLLVLVFFGLFARCRGKGSGGEKEAARPHVTGVAVEAAALSQADEYVETSGTVKARTVSTIASRMMGTLTSVKVREGDRVQAGQILATVDDSDVVQKVKAAEKAVEAAEQQKSLADITYQRYKGLHDDKALTGQELDQVATQKKVADMEYERARATWREAEVYHGFTRIIAPFSGVVVEKKAEPGSMAVPGMPLFILEDTSGFRIEAGLDEKYAGIVQRGMQAMITIDSLNRVLPGTVSDVIPSIDPLTRTFLVKIAISGEGMRNGSYVKVSIPVAKKDKLLVYRKAVVERGQLTGLYTVDSSFVITYRLVRTGRTYGDKVEVLSGISPGENIIVHNVEKAVDGGMLVQAK